MTNDSFKPEQVLDLWFPDNGHQNNLETHRAFWTTRMQGGMDEVICRDFVELTTAAVLGQLDHWAETPRGRLALLITLDQFPRSLWRNTPMAYAQDIKSTRLALEGIRNGDYAALGAPWEQNFYVIAISHCEGPDHLVRMEMLHEITLELVDNLPPVLEPLKEIFVGQIVRVTSIIENFGRHPHRNEILGRLSTPNEEAYIAEGDFPHIRKPEVTTST